MFMFKFNFVNVCRIVIGVDVYDVDACSLLVSGGQSAVACACCRCWEAQ